MTEEIYVSFEVAKLLKEKGFNTPCFDFYEVEYEVVYKKHSQRCSPVDWNGEDGDNCYSCPTHQMVVSWIREIPGIAYNIFVFADGDLGNLHYCYEIQEINNELLSCDGSLYDEDVSIDKCFETPEDACEAAIKYCLENLI